MKMSPHGRAVLSQREGRRLVAYRDTRGVWTIGVGHSSEAGTPPPVRPGMTITAAQCDAILRGDLAPREAVLSGWLKRPATQSQFDAMLSLMFNIGAGAFKGSAVLHLFNEGRLAEAADAFLHFDHPAELAGRRKAERAQFMSC
jgi:lysozyme